MKFEKDATYVVALGGLGEVGKNMYAFMHNNEIFVIDAGVMFPESDLLGVDYVIQDTSFLKENEAIATEIENKNKGANYYSWS